MAQYHGLKLGNSILDVGCGKAFLLYVSGIDILKYGIEHVEEKVKPYLEVGLAQELPYPDKSFDLIILINTIHNLYICDVKKSN